MANATYAGKSTIGVKNVVLAQIITDTTAELEYDDDLLEVQGAINITANNSNSDPDVQYADDIEWDSAYPDPEVEITIEWANLPAAAQAAIMGSAEDSKGVVFKAATDTPPYFAIGFEAVKSGTAGRKVWFYKCRPSRMDESFATKQGTTINRQTNTVKFTAVKRTYDGKYCAVCDSDTGADVYDDFLDEPYTTPVSTGGGT